MKRLLLTLAFICLSLPAIAAEKETAYDRVMRTGTIRCGYGTAAPWIYQDLKTGKMAGPYVDLMNEVAKQLSFKLDWPEETGWANLPTSLADGRVDVACSTLWIDPARGKQVAYTRPLFYSTVHAYSRADDTRFTGKEEELDKPEIRIAVQDGDASAALAHRYFPHAQVVALPQTASVAEFYLNVVDGKADIVLADAIAVTTFNDAQEKKLKRIPLPHPVAVYGSALAVGIRENALKEMLDATILYLIDSGKIGEIMGSFTQKYPDALLPIAKPYEAHP